MRTPPRFKTFSTLTQINMIQTITQLRKTCIAGCAIALCSLGLQAQNAELVRLSVPVSYTHLERSVGHAESLEQADGLRQV